MHTHTHTQLKALSHNGWQKIIIYMIVCTYVCVRVCEVHNTLHSALPQMYRNPLTVALFTDMLEIKCLQCVYNEWPFRRTLIKLCKHSRKFTSAPAFSSLALPSTSLHNVQFATPFGDYSNLHLIIICFAEHTLTPFRAAAYRDSAAARRAYVVAAVKSQDSIKSLSIGCETQIYFDQIKSLQWYKYHVIVCEFKWVEL